VTKLKSSKLTRSLRITPEGFKRGTRVVFKKNTDKEICLKYPLPSYTVISVFQGTITLSGKTEVTVRDINGDCYGYISSENLEKENLNDAILF
jgi:hypothetical protein